MANIPLSHTSSPQQSPTVVHSGGMMHHHLRVQHPGYSPHTTPHHSPSVVYTPTTTQQQNIFQFHEGMHHPNVIDDSMLTHTQNVMHSPQLPMHSPNVANVGNVLHSPNVAMHSPNVAMHSPHVQMQSPNVAMPSPNVPLQSPNMPLHSPNVTLHSPVPQSPSSLNQRYHKPRFAFPPNVDSLNVKTELNANYDEKSSSSPLVTYQDQNQSSPANNQNLRGFGSANNPEVMLASMNYSDNEMLRDGSFDVPVASMSGLSDNLMTTIASQQTGSNSAFDLFDGEDGYMVDQSQDLQIAADSFPETTTSFSLPSNTERDLGRSTSVAMTTASSVLMSSVAVTEAKPMAVKPRSGRGGRGGRLPGHRPNLTCQICGKKFNNSSAIAKHKLTHSDERKYACSICAKAFKRQDHLNGHMLTHRDKKPYECKFENCDKSYSDARSLRRHLENHHSMIEQQQQYQSSRIGQFGSNYNNQSGGQYFQFDNNSGGIQYPDGSSANDANSHTAAGQWHQFRSGDRSPGYIQQVSPISPAPGTQSSHSDDTNHTRPPQQRPAAWMFDDGPKAVQCSLCHRRFKNVPALNGHMRLHGGYFKKDTESIKQEDKQDAPKMKQETPEVGQMLPPLQTTFGQKSKAVFQKPVVPPAPPKQSNYNLQNQPTDLSRKVYDIPDDIRRLQAQKLLLDERREKEREILMSTLPVHQVQDGRIQMINDPHGAAQVQAAYLASLASQTLPSSAAEFAEANAVAATLAEMSCISRAIQDPASRDLIPHDLPPSILERRLLGLPPGVEPTYQQLKYTDERRYSGQETEYDADPENHLSIKSPTTGAIFNFPERAPQHLSVTGMEGERKRHLSADADKFTSPKRLEHSDPALEHAQMNQSLDDSLFPRPRAPMMEDMKRPKQITRDDPLSRSCPSGALFRNPGEPPSALGRRRKPRPEPLFIPPHVNSFGFHSRLRSPRLWDIKKDGGCTPPPYTPPPMLSPVRRGGGLFWTIQPYRPVTPKSAPITPKLLVPRQTRIIPVVEPEVEFQPEVDEEPPPETDIKPHVNVGKQYQAELPEIRQYHSGCRFSDWEDLVWCPESEGDNSLDEIQCYMDFACCAAVPGSSTNKEYAIHLLHYSRGDIQRALTLLMIDAPQFPKNHVLATYKYDETENWTTSDIETFHQAMTKNDKDFYRIGRECFKTTKQCIEFYYLWKKVCPDEYKRLRILRRKKSEQDELYNLRSKAGEDGAPPVTTADSSTSPMKDSDHVSLKSFTKEVSAFKCDYPECTASFPSRQALSGHVKIHAQIRAPAVLNMSKSDEENVPSPGEDTGTGTGEEFPCRVCGKVFSKVKSRNAHMRRHRPTDNN